jgi:hypothetical protein
VKKGLIIPLLLSLMLLLMVPGCKEQAATSPATATPSTGGLSQQELQQILTGSILAVKSASTFKYVLDMNLNIEASGGSKPGKMAATIKSNGTADIVAKQMQMIFEISLNENTLGSKDSTENLSAEIFMLPDSVYVKMDIPGMGKQWIKMPLSEDLKEIYNLDMVNEQLALLESPAKIEFVRYETFDGSECYVLKIVPDMEKVKQWLGQQQMTSTKLDWDKLANLQDMFKELSFITWIAKDTKLMKKMNFTVLMEIDAKQVNDNKSDFEKMSIDADMNMILQNYSQPVSIVLPEEAANAIEMPRMEKPNE